MRQLLQEEIDEEIRIITELGLKVEHRVVWHAKFMQHVWRSRRRKLDSELTFKQYVVKAVEAGLTSPHQIGNRIGQYNLGREGDIGNYTVDNCRFITSTQNRQEMFQNNRHIQGFMRRGDFLRGKTKENCLQFRKTSETMRGRTKYSHASIASATDKLSKSFELTDPNGNVFRGKNISDFCKLHNLHQGSISEVCRGIKVNHKGWTGRYTDQVNEEGTQLV